MKLGLLRREAVGKLMGAGVEDARLQVDWLIEHELGLNRAEVIAAFDRDLTSDEQDGIFERVHRRVAGEPIQYIVGWTEFFGLRISVRPGVLIPRPETEVLIEEVLSLVADRPFCRILDLGTGSGCMALAVKSRCPDASIVACDSSEVALGVAVSNARSLGLKVDFISADMEDPAWLTLRSERFDVVMSNPPYVPNSDRAMLSREVRDHEPHEALFAGSDPLRYYRAVMDRTIEVVEERGSMVVEIHADYARQVAEMADGRGLRDVRLRRDLAGLPRVITAFR